MSRALGVLMMIAAAAMLGYFWLEFDISRPVPDHPLDKFNPYYYAPGRAINEGLMNDRVVGALVAIAIGLAGLMIFVNAKVHQRTGWRRAPSPQPPIGFNYDLSFAMHYVPRPGGHPLMSRLEWTRAVSHLANLHSYQPDQIDWAYDMGVDPRNFESYIRFIEEYRSWQFSGGLVRAG